MKFAVAVSTVPPFAEYVTTKGAGVALADAAEATLFPVVFRAIAVKV